MKIRIVIAACILLATCAPLSAQEAPPLGSYHFTADYGVMMIQHVTFATDDAGIALGLAGYKHLGKDWYLGGKLGVGGSLMIFGDSSDITMVEVNGKRAFPLTGPLVLALGAGLSYNSVSYNDYNWFGSEDDQHVEDWVLGTQVLTDLTLRLGQVLVGLQTQYMLTGDVKGAAELAGESEGWDYSNWTIGLHAGFLLR